MDLSKSICYIRIFYFHELFLGIGRNFAGKPTKLYSWFCIISKENNCVCMCQWLIPLPKNKFASLLEYSVNFFLVAWSFKYKLIDLKAFFLFQSLKDYGIVLLLGDDNRLRTKVCKSSVYDGNIWHFDSIGYSYFRLKFLTCRSWSTEVCCTSPRRITPMHSMTLRWLQN